jgi:hypothetical protein
MRREIAATPSYEPSDRFAPHDRFDGMEAGGFANALATIRVRALRRREPLSVIGANMGA